MIASSLLTPSWSPPHLLRYRQCLSPLQSLNLPIRIPHSHPQKSQKLSTAPGLDNINSSSPKLSFLAHLFIKLNSTLRYLFSSLEASYQSPNTKTCERPVSRCLLPVYSFNLCPKKTVAKYILQFSTWFPKKTVIPPRFIEVALLAISKLYTIFFGLQEAFPRVWRLYICSKFNEIDLRDSLPNLFQISSTIGTYELNTNIFLIIFYRTQPFYPNFPKISNRHNPIINPEIGPWYTALQPYIQPIRRIRRTHLQYRFLTLTKNFFASTAQFSQLLIFSFALDPQNSLLLPLESHLRKHLRIRLWLLLFHLPLHG